MKNDFCVEEMMETQFPEKYRAYECGDYYDHYYVMAWFKRCIEDMGVGIKEGFPCDWALMSWEEWFKKWFSQFIEKGDKDEG